MHITKATKAVFILANYVTANLLIPPHLKPHARLEDHDDGNNAHNNSPHLSTNPSPSAGRSINHANVPPTLLPRQQQQQQQQKSCDRCRKRCPPGKIINPNNCKRCVRCPAGTMPDPITNKKCIRKDRKQEKEKDYQKKKKEKKREHKIKKYEKKKHSEQMKHNDRELRKKDNERRKKVRRAGRCLPLVAVSMGAAAAAEFADEFFDEAYLESMDLEQYWPDGLPVEPWDTEESDKIFEEDEYVDSFVTVGNAVGGARRVKARGVDLLDYDHDNSTGLVESRNGPGETTNPNMLVFGPDGLITDTTGTSGTLTTREVEQSELEERFFQALIPIFGAIITTVARVASRAGSAAGNVLRVSRYSIKVGKGKSSKKSYKEQSEGAKKISQSKNWKRCLSRQKPE